MAPSADPQAREQAKAKVQAMFDRYHVLAKRRPQDHRDFDHEVMRSIKIIDAGPEGYVQFEMTISKNFSNLNEVMHGGAAGVIFDMATTSALCPLQKPGFWEFLGGVTRTLNISYLRAVPIGTTVRLSSQVLQVGKTMAFIRGTMTSVDGKIVYCTAEHHKVNLPPVPEHMTFNVETDQIDWVAERKAREQAAKL